MNVAEKIVQVPTALKKTNRFNYYLIRILKNDKFKE